MPVLSQYEQAVIQEIARSIVEPGNLVKTLEFGIRPVERALESFRSTQNPLIRKVESATMKAIRKGIETAMQTASKSVSDQQILRQYHRHEIYLRSMNDIKNIRLSCIDKVADSYQLKQNLWMGAEGAFLGAATAVAEGSLAGTVTVPLLVATDVSLSLSLLARHVSLLAATYGYSPQNPLHLPHLLAALAPHQKLGDESYLAGKTMAIQAIIQSKQFLLAGGGRLLEERILEQQAPYLLRLLTYVLQRLGFLFTEKELLLLLPVAGAVLNSGTNLLFQRLGQATAKNYFRLLWLEEQYGREMIRDLLASAIEQRRDR